MTMTTRQRLLWTVCASSLLLLSSGCGSETEAPKCGEPLYGGSATDEAWMTMVDAQSKPTDSSRAVTLMSPTEGETLAASATPPRFSWTSPLRASLEQDRPSRYAQARPRPSRGVLSWVAELLVPTAEAHLPPFTGDIYFLEITVPGRECPLQVLTSELAWQVDTASWSTLGEVAGQDLRLQVTSAYLQDNRIKEGPFRLETPRTFRRAATAP
jgi:hypothetical protein